MICGRALCALLVERGSKFKIRNKNRSFWRTVSDVVLKPRVREHLLYYYCAYLAQLVMIEEAEA